MRAFGRWGALTLAAMLAGCASHPRPITKVVNGRVIVTRSVSPSAYEHVARALFFEEQERWQEAAAELQRALIYDGHSPELHARLAEVFLRLGRIADAASEVRASLAAGETVDGLMAQARLARGRHDWAGVVASLERAAALASFDEDMAQAENAHLALAEAALMALDAPRAHRTLTRLCQQAPASLSGRIRLAALSWAMGEPAEAERHLNEALTEEPNEIEALVSLALLQGAQGRGSQARAAFAEALERSEGSPEVAAEYVRYLVNAGEIGAAVEVISELPVPDLHDPEALAARLSVERAARRFDEALGLLRAAAQASPPEAVANRMPLWEAEVLAARGDKDRAVALLLGVGQGSLHHFEARLRAAEILREERRANEALRALAAVAAQEGDAAEELVVARALAEEHQGDSARAIRRVEEALDQARDSGRLILALAALEERRGGWRRALALTEPLLRRHPDDVEVLNFWGFVAVDHGHELPRATKRLLTALALRPGASAIVDSVGWAHFRAGDLPRAALFLEQAGRLDPDDPEILAHLGDLYLRRAEPERAAATFRRALAQRPEESLRRRLEEALVRLGAQRSARP